MRMILGGIATAVLTFGILYLLNRFGPRKPNKLGDGLRELRFSTGYKTVGLLCLPGALFFMLIGYMAHRQSGAVVIPLLMPVLALLAVVQAYMIFIRKVQWTSSSLFSIHPFYTVEIAWKDVVSIRHLHSLGSVIIADRHGRRIFVPDVRSSQALGRMLRRMDFQLLRGDLFDTDPDRIGLRPDTAQSFVYELGASSSWGNRSYEFSHGAAVTVEAGAARLIVPPHVFPLKAGQQFLFPSSLRIPAVVVTDEGEHIRLRVSPLVRKSVAGTG